jgi:hypothetical protein
MLQFLLPRKCRTMKNVSTDEKRGSTEPTGEQDVVQQI